jgi:hypothetical protein
MGYIGLLLNAPYKIDSMVWMRLMISFCGSSLTEALFVLTGYMNQKGIFEKKAVNVDN